MRAICCLHKSKRGQFGFDLTDIFSYLGYFIAVLIIILILNLPGCLTGIDKSKAESKLEEKTEAMALVRADAQLTSYLRAQMPGKDELFAKLDWVYQHKDMLRTRIPGSTSDDLGAVTSLTDVAVKLDVGQAKGFLNSHPEVYVDKDYSEFISGLHAVYAANKNEKGNAEMTFKVVTTAMFTRGFSDAKKLGGYIYYLFPLSVDFQNSNPGESGNDGDYDLSVGILPTEMLPQRKPLQSIQVIPLADSTVAKVRLAYYPELSSWLPRP